MFDIAAERRSAVVECKFAAAECNWDSLKSFVADELPRW